MTKAELIKALESFPDDIEVRIGVGGLCTATITEVKQTTMFVDSKTSLPIINIRWKDSDHMWWKKD